MLKTMRKQGGFTLIEVVAADGADWHYGYHAVAFAFGC